MDKIEIVSFKEYEEAKDFVIYFVKLSVESIGFKEWAEKLEILKRNISMMYEYVEVTKKMDKRLGLFEDSEVLKNCLNKVVGMRRKVVSDNDNRISKIRGSFVSNANTPYEAKLCLQIEESIKSLGRLVSLNL